MFESKSQHPKRPDRSRFGARALRTALAALLALPAVAHAGTGVFTTSTQTLPGTSITYTLATAPDTNSSNASLYPSYCGTNYNAFPYVMVVVGGYGHFYTAPGGAYNPSEETNYYTNSLDAMVNALRSKCTRVINVQTTGWSIFDYTGAVSLPAEPAGADYWVNLPLRRSASFVRAVIMHTQSKAAYSGAPHWYLQGGSGSSLHSAKLLDVYRTDADANASGFVFPVATALVSLPNSGNIWNGCANSNDYSLVKSVLNTVYKPIFGYTTSTGYVVTACQNIVANPNAHNWKFLTGVGLSRYLNSGRKITIMNGANDTLYKIDGNFAAFGWTMDNLLRDFGAVTGKCSNQAFSTSNDLAVVNTNRKYQCEARLAAWLYQNGGHGPINKTNSPSAVVDLANTALASGDVKGVIDGVSNNAVGGWACSHGSKAPIAVHLYVGGSAGVGTIIGGYAAANYSEPAVAAACGTNASAYRFSIPLSYSTRVAHAGKKIYIHAIHPTGATPNWLLTASGVYAVPAP